MAARSRTAIPPRVPLALLALGLALVAFLPSAAGAPSDAEARATFRKVVEAWRAEDARRLTALMPRQGRVRLALTSPSIRGSYGTLQARRVLKTYFGKVSGVRLKDVTPAGHRDDAAYRVRQFEYQYSAQGQGRMRTVLRITLKAEGDARWTLVAVEESSRRRSRR